MIIALIVLATVFLLCFAVGGYLFFAACGKHKEIHWLDEAEISRTPYGQFYPHVKAAYEWLAKHNARDLHIKSFDGTKLHATWVPHENGKSGGRFTTFGVKESRDMLEWIDYHNQHFGSYPMLLSGLSMGAATVMFLADEDLPENVKYCVADCGFTSPKQIISKVFRDVVHIPAGSVIWSADLFARVFAGFSLEEKNSLRTLKENKLPFFFVHGLADDFVPCEMTERSFEACAGEKHLLLVEGAGHGVSYIHAKKKYNEMNVAIIDRLFPKKK